MPNLEVTGRLCGFISETKFEDLPSDAVAAAKRAILDGIGVALAGSREECSAILTNHIRKMGGNPISTVIRGGFRTSPPQAALANGTMLHAIDYDDVNASMAGHPTAPILPAILALGEAEDITGERAIEAFVIGFEVEAKIGLGVNPVHYSRGWHATSTLGTLGAAASAGKILKLDEKRMARALGIAASQAAGLKRNFGTMTKPLHAGHAASCGVTATLLAESGFTADDGILEGESGFCRLFTDGGECDPERIARNLGDPYDIVNPGLALKPYPSCRCSHPAIDAISSLISKHDILPDDVTKVEVLVDPTTKSVLTKDRPLTALEGKFSMQYCMAASLLWGRVGMGEFTDEKVWDERARRLMERVTMGVHPEMERRSSLGDLAAEVIVQLKNGERRAARVDVPKGDPENPMSDEELIEKFRDCAGLVMEPDRVENLLDTLAKIEKLTTIREITGQLG